MTWFWLCILIVIGYIKKTKKVRTWFLWRFQGDFKIDFINHRCPLGSTKVIIQQEAEEAGAGYIQDLAVLLVTFLGMVKTWPFEWLSELRRSGIKRSLCLNHLGWIFFNNPDLPTVAPKMDVNIGVPKAQKYHPLPSLKLTYLYNPKIHSWKMILSGFGKSYFLGGENVSCSAGKFLNSHPF